MTRRRRALPAAVAVLALVAGGGWYVRAAQHSPITVEEAVERFEAELEAGREAGREAEREAERQAAASAGPQPAAIDPGGAPAAAGGAPVTRTGAASGGAPAAVVAGEAVPAAPAATATPATRRPDQGLYAYDTSGEEGIGVFTRKFEPQSFRTIVHRRDGGWSDHHYFSDQRESWSTFSLAGDRRLVHSQRNRVVIPPITKDVTLTFTPPLTATPLPWRLGRTWSEPLRGRASGSDNGEVTGTLRGRTRELTTLRIGGRDVPTWIDHLQLELHGAVEGDVDVTRWLSPATGLTVREEYRADVALGGGLTYRASWTVQLRTLDRVR